MKTFDVKALSVGERGEYVLGMKDLGTHACYMIYGTLGPGEGGRQVKPGLGHEEILCVVVGRLLIHGPDGVFELKNGHAVHVRENQSFEVSNPDREPAVYVMAGGHGTPHH
jgi:mannose-6-phosphate isomerase-like protein (cupin superfamily)